MMFPPKPLWKIIREEVPSSASSYVVKYLGTVQPKSIKNYRLFLWGLP